MRIQSLWWHLLKNLIWLLVHEPKLQGPIKIMTSSNQAASSDLLRQVSSDDIGLLINDLELSKEGYVINYIIDPYDIYRFSFPYGIRFHQSYRPINEIGDEMIAYSYVFEKYNPIILDEYRLELFVTRNNVYKYISKHNN